jgi:hypothetical protein
VGWERKFKLVKKTNKKLIDMNKNKKINCFNDNNLKNISLIRGGEETLPVMDYNELSAEEKSTVVFENPPKDGKPAFGKTHYIDGCGRTRTDIIIFWIDIKFNPDCPQ